MPERVVWHKNTIGSGLSLAIWSRRYGFVRFGLTVIGGAHISPAPDDERGRRSASEMGRGDRRIQRGALLDEEPDLLVVRSMHCLLGKGYAGGGEHDVLRHGLFSSSLVRKFDVSWIE